MKMKMEVTRYETVFSFRESCLAFLEMHVHSADVILRVTGRNPKPHTPNTEEYYISVDTNGAGQIAVAVCCMWTPPFQVVIAGEGDDADEAATFLGNWFRENGLHPDGVLGLPTTTSNFAKGLLQDRYVSGKYVRMRQNVMKCQTQTHQSESPRTQATGHLRALQYDDKQEIDIVKDWWVAFVDECHLPEREKDDVEEVINHERIHSYVWISGDKGEIVSWVGCSVSKSNTDRFRCIGPVFTPKQYRGRGYASEAVAALTTKLLDLEGVDFTTLHSDAANPTSNKIYERVGYRTVCELVWLDWSQG